jgi:serine protease Do
MQLRDLTAAESQSLKIKGVVVTDVLPTGLAARAGLLPGDVITRLNNTETPTASTLLNAIRSLPSNRVVRVGILRDGVPAIIGMRIE